MSGPRARDLGLDIPGSPGPHNAITDVPGVLVGMTTIVEGDGPFVVGQGPVRTGVTAILPRGHDRGLQPVWAGCHTFNGNGEMTGVHWVNDGGYFVGPVCITNTHSVGIAHHAATKWMVARHPERTREHHLWFLPIVAETYDGVLNDIDGQHVTEDHVVGAIDGARDGPVDEGNAGGGTGMICYEFKGGTGTASRRVEIAGEDFTVGCLVQANHGRRDWLSILGAPVGRHMREGLLDKRGEEGSIIVVIATDIPMMPHQLARLARRATVGIGRHGTPGGNSSGDIFLAFSVANPVGAMQFAPERLNLDFINDWFFDPIYLAAVEATEEAVINALVAASDMSTLKPAGHVCKAIDHDELVSVMRRYGRLRR